MAIPSGTPVTIATPTATLTIDRCSSVRSPMAGRLCRMNASVSIVLPGYCDFAAWAQPRGESVSNGAQLVNHGVRAVGGWAKTCDSCISVLRAPTPVTTPVRLSLLQRLDLGPVICAEGYVFELERR